MIAYGPDKSDYLRMAKIYLWVLLVISLQQMQPKR
jgi:hypothetical protein